MAVVPVTVVPVTVVPVTVVPVVALVLVVPVTVVPMQGLVFKTANIIFKTKLFVPQNGFIWFAWKSAFGQPV